MNKLPTVLLTGVTGGLGAELLPRLLKNYPNHTVVALIRASNNQHAEERLSDVMRFGSVDKASQARVAAVASDVCATRLGMSDQLWQDLVSRTDAVFHLAANVGFSLSLQESRLSNLVSTQRILEFCSACIVSGQSEFRLNHVSTAYVCGKRRGQIKENELQTGQHYWNAYEQSKAEAEQLVTDCRSDIPSTIYRPSQIIGDSSTGRVRKYFGLYELLQLGCRGKLATLPGNAAVRQDFVPVDYVCDAMVYLSLQNDAIGRTYHLAAGLEQSLPLDQAMQLMYSEYLNSRSGKSAAPMPKIQQPTSEDTDRQGKSGLLQLILNSYLPYMDYERDFDISSTRTLLNRAGIPFPAIDSTLRRTVRYALGARFR